MMSQPLKLRDPKRTTDTFPHTQIHGKTVLAFDERHKDYVEATPKEVREKPRVYRFWLECLRRTDRASDHQPDRRKQVKHGR